MSDVKKPDIGILKITRLDDASLRVKIAIRSQVEDISDAVLSVTVQNRFAENQHSFKTLEREILEQVAADLKSRSSRLWL